MVNWQKINFGISFFFFFLHMRNIWYMFSYRFSFVLKTKNKKTNYISVINTIYRRDTLFTFDPWRLLVPPHIRKLLEYTSAFFSFSWPLYFVKFQKYTWKEKRVPHCAKIYILKTIAIDRWIFPIINWCCLPCVNLINLLIYNLERYR